MELTSEVRLQAVHPVLAAKTRAVDDAFAAETGGDRLLVVQGLRSWQQQQLLWLRGRKQQEDGTYIITDVHQIVTYAPPGHSWHEFALAVDGVPKSLIGTPGWAPESPLWALIEKLAEQQGLVSGKCWQHKDLPHLQLSGIFPVSPTDEVRDLFRAGGLLKVWDATGIQSA